ncbi:GNAT family N-acetyltransferase [Corynebacterium mendelii]|uniref:GNAT family N-acetyltransferase n=1 Tax=Corynebacterium mendelii TaxID=2765362 RepID=A0A939IYH4_9CORY|nr:GNAT family N-acetyltransferase [Corynebacterium mendelii]MBN9644677.1 hypothetical protein [Corynebacterium mendelii]
MDKKLLLNLYDAQLRSETEVSDSREVVRIGPLWVARYPHRHGFITYESIPPETNLSKLIDLAMDHFLADERIDSVEWKTREHDGLENLHNLLSARGFKECDPETVMVGYAQAIIAAASPLPEGFVVEPVSSPADIQLAQSLIQDAFEAPVEEAQRLTDQLVARYNDDPASFELWVVREPGGKVVCTGRTEFLPSTEVAGLWGGACEKAYRGRGLYRALTAARASSALRRGYRYLHADCTEDSRPILERAGLVKVTTTTPFVWQRHKNQPDY